MQTMPVAQKGMSMIGTLFVVVIAIFFVTVTFKLGPAYMGFLTMRSLMDAVAESSSSEPILGGGGAILRVLENRMMVNDVRNIDPKSFTVKRAGEETFNVVLAYERREHLFFNIDALLTFDHSVVVKGR